jgi:hypothetical protein
MELFPKQKNMLFWNYKDERRIMGWPAEWPNNPEKGYFVLEDAMWLTVDHNGKSGAVPLDTLDKILIAAHNVEMVEFVKDEEDIKGRHNES